MQKIMVSTLAVLVLGARGQAAPAQQNGAAATGSDTTTQQVERGPESDPNMPGQSSPPNLPIQWIFGGDTRPTIYFKGALHSSQNAEYLGFNDDGTWLVHPDNGKIYVWNLKTFSLKERYASFKDVPLQVFASLRNPGGSTEGVLARNNKPGKKPPVAAGNNPSAGIFGNDTRKTLESALPPHTGGAPSVEGAGFHGTDASVKGGILTFTLANGSKATYKVVRPGIMASNRQAASAGIAGTWLSFGDGDKAMMFNVGTDNTVTGKEMPSALVERLTPGGGQR